MAVLITGGTKGIGLAIAKRVARPGLPVRNLFGAGTDAFLASEAAQNPSGRNIGHDDYTGLVAFLASEEASMIQGQVIFVNGGQYAVA